MKKSIVFTRLFIVIIMGMVGLQCLAQKIKAKTNLVYVDKKGILKYTKGNQPAAFFGVNYTTPFAYAYRALKKLDVPPAEAIRQDVYHFARLGFNAFRVHVWDTEISDAAGNLLNNEHLRLFDFLLAELKKRNIKTIITPIAFWGNGYPERDENTPGFSRLYGRGKLTTNDSAIRAQENYLQQFFKHVNPYTNLSYEADKDIIAVEINNEPSHSGPMQGVTSYINRLAAAIKSTGFSKPLFYNISQSPYYATAVAASVVDGYSFQWYPSGLVGGASLKGNTLPNVDQYRIPYRDSIPAFANKALMVYEFDAADVWESYMYPAMAKSFRQAGFQWATQFAYDPLAIAHANTEYQTHYLNLAYTPSRAISMLIAAKVFQWLPLFGKNDTYPADSAFDVFRVSYSEALSEMNTDKEFYYSNTTNTKPVAVAALEHIAGVGNSPVVRYPGTGAYFFDKLAPGVWRLELMPDAVHIRDPFEKASPGKTVTTIRWRTHLLQINLTDLGNDFTIKGVNTGNTFEATASAASCRIGPGTYLITGADKQFNQATVPTINGTIAMNEFVAPPASPPSTIVRHQPVGIIPAGYPFTIRATIDCGAAAVVTVQISNTGSGRPGTYPMVKKQGYEYIAELPAAMLTPGQLTYRIIVQEGDQFVSFPGQLQGRPGAWDNPGYEYYQANIATADAPVILYTPAAGQSIHLYPNNQRNVRSSYITGEDPSRLQLRLSATDMKPGELMGMQYFIGDKITAAQPVLSAVDNLVVRAATNARIPVTARVSVIDNNGMAFSVNITLTNEMRDIAIPLTEFSMGERLLLPGAYPGFQPKWFKPTGVGHRFNINHMEKLEIITGPHVSPTVTIHQYHITIATVKLTSVLRSTSAASH